MSILLDTINDLMLKIDCLPCQPKNKLLLYHCFVLSKLAWHLTIADLSKTWVIENLDNVVSSYVRQWLDLPISATFSSLILKISRNGINLILPSIKFIECRTIIRNALKSSPNPDIKSLWVDTSYGTNPQYDQLQNVKQVLKAVHHKHEDRIKNTLFSQGLVISSNSEIYMPDNFTLLVSGSTKYAEKYFQLLHKISQQHSSNSKKSLQMVHFSIVSMFTLPSIRNFTTHDI